MPITDPNLFLVVLFAIAVAAGFLGSLLGLGGGLLVIPALTLLFHIDIHYAFGASMVAIIATSCAAAATYVRKEITNIRVGMFLEVATTSGAIVGVTLLAMARTPALYIGFGLVLLLSFVLTLRRGRDVPSGAVLEAGRLSRYLRLEGAYYDGYLDREVRYAARRPLAAFGSMLGAGTVSGLMGVGSGPFKVLSMDLLMGLPIKVSTATSNFMIGVTAAASAGVYFARGYVNPFITAPVALGVFLGAILGARWLPQLKSAFIRKIFALVVAVVALQMIARGLGLEI